MALLLAGDWIVPATGEAIYGGLIGSMISWLELVGELKKGLEFEVCFEKVPRVEFIWPCTIRAGPFLSALLLLRSSGDLKVAK